MTEQVFRVQRLLVTTSKMRCQRRLTRTLKSSRAPICRRTYREEAESARAWQMKSSRPVSVRTWLPLQQAPIETEHSLLILSADCAVWHCIRLPFGKCRTGRTACR